MRFISSLLITALASTTLTTQIADACGGRPTPRLLAVSSHGFMADGNWVRRSFVVLDQTPQLDRNTVWKLVAPGTSDPTKIATVPWLATRAVTLIGPSGVRVVEIDKEVALSHSPRIGLDQTPRTAVEVSIGDYEEFPIAIAGRASDAKWHSLGNNTATDATKHWLAKRGIKAQHVKLRAIPDRNFDVLQYYVNGAPHLVVRRGDREVSRAFGAAIGGLTLGGRNFVVYSTAHAIGTLELPGGRGGAQR